MKYDSNDGMSTKFWGPNAWNFLFTCILGRYPYKIDEFNGEHLQIKQEFKYLFTNTLSSILPCVFCRDSYKDFIKQLPIDTFLDGRVNLFYWLYLLKDLVNKKLIKQEEKCFKDDKRKLKKKLKNGEINKKTFKKKVEKLERKIFKTVPTPPFKKVLDNYEQYRAKCHAKSKSCSKLVKK